MRDSTADTTLGHEAALAEIEPLIPRYTGNVPPMRYNRFPDERLSAD